MQYRQNSANNRFGMHASQADRRTISFFDLHKRAVYLFVLEQSVLIVARFLGLTESEIRIVSLPKGDTQSLDKTRIIAFTELHPDAQQADIPKLLQRFESAIAEPAAAVVLPFAAGQSGLALVSSSSAAEDAISAGVQAESLAPLVTPGEVVTPADQYLVELRRQREVLMIEHYQLAMQLDATNGLLRRLHDQNLEGVLVNADPAVVVNPYATPVANHNPSPQQRQFWVFFEEHPYQYFTKAELAQQVCSGTIKPNSAKTIVSELRVYLEAVGSVWTIVYEPTKKAYAYVRRPLPIPLVSTLTPDEQVLFGILWQHARQPLSREFLRLNGRWEKPALTTHNLRIPHAVTGLTEKLPITGLGTILEIAGAGVMFEPAIPVPPMSEIPGITFTRYALFAVLWFYRDQTVPNAVLWQRGPWQNCGPMNQKAIGEMGRDLGKDLMRCDKGKVVADPGVGLRLECRRTSVQA